MIKNFKFSVCLIGKDNSPILDNFCSCEAAVFPIVTSPAFEESF